MANTCPGLASGSRIRLSSSTLPVCTVGSFHAPGLKSSLLSGRAQQVEGGTFGQPERRTIPVFSLLKASPSGCAHNSSFTKERGANDEWLVSGLLLSGSAASFFVVSVSFCEKPFAHLLGRAIWTGVVRSEMMVKTIIFNLDQRTRGRMVLLCGVGNEQLTKRNRWRNPARTQRTGLIARSSRTFTRNGLQPKPACKPWILLHDGLALNHSSAESHHETVCSSRHGSSARRDRL